LRLDLFHFAPQALGMKSKRKVLLALSIAKQYFIRGIVRYAREHDWYLVTDMMYTGRVPLGWRGDGILTILGYRRELVDFIRAAQVPTVAITLINDQIALPRVEGDNVRIGQLAAEHFLERGYRHFAWAPFLNDAMDTERHEGFDRALGKHGLTSHVLPQAHTLTGNAWKEDWSERRQRLIAELRRLPRPTAIFAYNDYVAADLIDACRDARLLVPEQIAVLGVDNDPDICDCAPVPLSSIIHDLEGMAYEGAALLDRLMRGGRPPARILRVPPKGIVTRVSTDMRAVENVKVAIAVRHISEHYGDHLLAVGDVAAAAGLSRRQLERAFRKEMGCSLNEHIVRTRLQAVATRLTQTQDKVVAIARQTGFTRPSHLFRAFRAHFRTSPRRFRRRADAARQTPRPSASPKIALALAGTLRLEAGPLSA
jgi:LacI family transcriptional regulator